jgi:1-phosphatidylinositol phosphodiesterase
MNEVDSHKWMSGLPDQLKLCELTVPGTHNSCAFNCNLLSRCQAIGVQEQLEIGVRYLDIRCRHMRDAFRMQHGIFDLGMDFYEHVIKVCIEFLERNSTETIIMLVSTEHKPKNNSIAFDQVFIDYVQRDPAHWYLQEQMPVLGQARGRIVLLRRFYSRKTPLGIDMSGWSNATFNMHNCVDFKFRIQDQYSLSLNRKWPVVLNLLNEANIQNCAEVDVWHLNYCSSQYIPLQIPSYIARHVNAHLEQYIKENFENKPTSASQKLKLGTIIVDFANIKLIKQIYMCNFLF